MGLQQGGGELREAQHRFRGRATVLHDDSALTIRDASADEDRHVTLGMDALGRILIVAYAWQGDDVRIISARKATPSERRQYEGNR